MRLGEEVIRYMSLKVKAQPVEVSEGDTEAAAEEE